MLDIHFSFAQTLIINNQIIRTHDHLAKVVGQLAIKNTIPPKLVSRFTLIFLTSIITYLHIPSFTHVKVGFLKVGAH